MFQTQTLDSSLPVQAIGGLTSANPAFLRLRSSRRSRYPGSLGTSPDKTITVGVGHAPMQHAAPFNRAIVRMGEPS